MCYLDVRPNNIFRQPDGDVVADARYAARAAGLALCARCSDEALRLAGEVGLDA